MARPKRIHIVLDLCVCILPALLALVFGMLLYQPYQQMQRTYDRTAFDLLLGAEALLAAGYAFAACFVAFRKRLVSWICFALGAALMLAYWYVAYYTPVLLEALGFGATGLDQAVMFILAALNLCLAVYTLVVKARRRR